MQRLGQGFSQRLDVDALDHLARESVDEQAARLVLAQAARAQVEHGVRRHLSDRRAVLALHVVGVDLEIGLGVDQAVLGEQQVLVVDLGVGLLRAFPDDDRAVEDGPRLAVEHSFIELAARAVGDGVVDQGMIVEVLTAAHEVKAVERDVGALAGEQHVDVVAHELPAQGDDVRGQPAVALDARLKRGDVQRSVALALQTVMREPGVFSDKKLRDHVREADAAVEADVLLDDARLRAVLKHDEHARVGHGRHVGRGRDEDQMDRLLEAHAFGHEHGGAVAEKRQVQRAERAPLGLAQLGEPRLEPRGLLLQNLGDGRQPRARRQRVRSGKLGAVSPVDEDQAVEAERAERQARERLHLDARDAVCEHEGSLLDRIDFGEAPVLVLGRREAGGGEAVDRLGAALVEPRQLRAGQARTRVLEVREEELFPLEDARHQAATFCSSQP